VDKKLIAFMGGGLLLGGGVFAWYVLYGDRMVGRDTARKPIETWEAAWHHTRTCLLGEHPVYADVGDELAVRAMEGKLGACALAGVGPPDDRQGTGIDEVEQAWEQVRTGWHDLSIAQPYPDRDAGPVRMLDAADARLREGAGMDPPPPGPTGKIRDLALGPVATKVSTDRLTARAHALTGGADLGWVTARSAKDVVLLPPSEAVRGWPDPSWGAMLLVPDAADDGPAAAAQVATITAGTIAATGELTGEGVVAKGKFSSVVAAIGGGASRAVVVNAGDGEIANGLQVLRTTDGGAHWSKPDPIVGVWITPSWASPGDPPVLIRPALDEAGAFLFFDEHGATSSAPAGVGIENARTCSVGRAIWYMTSDDDLLARAAPGEPPAAGAPAPDGGTPIACTADAVALRTNDRIYRCTRTECDAGMSVPGADEGFADVFDGGGVVFATQRGRLVGVWRNGDDPVFVRAPAGARLVGVAVWGKTPTFAFATDAGLRFATLP
jgi:hypothetical protein